MRISDYLNSGKENAKTSRELCQMLGLQNRDISAAVERERREGIPICASCGSNPGYYLAANDEEMEQYCKSLYRRLNEILKTYKACVETIGKIE